MTFSQNNRNWVLSTAALCFLLIGSASALAGPLATTNLALNDGFGPDAGRWHGSVSISAAALGDNVTAVVDWAAFAPGPKFQLYLNSHTLPIQANPAGPGEVIYVYQISSVTAASPGIDTLTVGVDPADARGTVSAPAFIPTGAATEQSPGSGGDNTTSMAWFFNGSELQPGDTSGLLVFTSPFAPELDFLAVNSGLAGSFAEVASISDRLFDLDVPEPTSLAMGLMSCVGLLLRSRKAR